MFAHNGSPNTKQLSAYNTNQTLYCCVYLLPPLLWQRTPVLRHQRQPGLRHFTSGRLSRRSSGSAPSRVLPKSECRPAGLTGRLVYWRRDSERDGKRGEPEGEPSLNETGIQVFFVVVVLFLHLTRLFCGLFTSSVLLFPLVEDGICEPASACFL